MFGGISPKYHKNRWHKWHKWHDLIIFLGILDFFTLFCISHSVKDCEMTPLMPLMPPNWNIFRYGQLRYFFTVSLRYFIVGYDLRRQPKTLGYHRGGWLANIFLCIPIVCEHGFCTEERKKRGILYY